MVGTGRASGRRKEFEQGGLFGDRVTDKSKKIDKSCLLAEVTRSSMYSTVISTGWTLGKSGDDCALPGLSMDNRKEML